LIIKNRHAKWVIGVSLCTIVAWVLIVGVVRTRKEVTIKRCEIALQQLPEAFDGYRIAFFSDLHIGSMTSATEMCRKVVEYLNSLDADLVVFGGDLINVRYDELSPEIQNILGGVKARDGVFAVLGNHDTGVYIHDTVAMPLAENTRLLKERIGQMGWQMLDDKTEWLVRGKDSLSLTGIGFSHELLEHRHSANVADSLDLRPIYEGVSCDKFNISVSHMPQLWSKISALGYGNLVLSGHVHAMQMKLQIGEFKFSPARLMYREWSGHYTEPNSHLYITDGVGSVAFHLRLGAPPEITELTLRRAD
jgi:predicted MPP superfamily phosphohydrolase